MSEVDEQHEMSTWEEVYSCEEPECTDHVAFAKAIEHAIQTVKSNNLPLNRRVVIAEGYQLLYAEAVRKLLSFPVILLELSRQECITRRSQRRSSLNRDPLSVREIKRIVWPAHLRYLQTSIDTLSQGAVHRFPSPSTHEQSQTEVEVLADKVLRIFNISGQSSHDDFPYTHENATEQPSLTVRSIQTHTEGEKK